MEIIDRIIKYTCGNIDIGDTISYRDYFWSVERELKVIKLGLYKVYGCERYPNCAYYNSIPIKNIYKIHKQVK